MGTEICLTLRRPIRECRSQMICDLWMKRFVNKAPVWGAEASSGFRFLFWSLYLHVYYSLLWIKCHSNDPAQCRETSIQQITGHGKVTVQPFSSVSAFNICMLTTNIAVTNVFSTFVLAATLIRCISCILWLRELTSSARNPLRGQGILSCAVLEGTCWRRSVVMLHVCIGSFHRLYVCMIWHLEWPYKPNKRRYIDQRNKL